MLYKLTNYRLKEFNVNLNDIQEFDTNIQVIPMNSVQNVLMKKKISEFYDKLQNIFENNTLYHLQCKLDLFSNTNRSCKIVKYFEYLFHTVVEKDIKQLLNISFYKIILRITSNPFNLQAHFDSTDNYILVLYGSKNIILFDLPQNITMEDEIKFLKDIAYMNNKQLAEYLYKLQNTTIAEYNIVKGDLLFIPAGKYHKVENIDDGCCSIILNMYNDENYKEHINERFCEIWGFSQPED